MTKSRRPSVPARTSKPEAARADEPRTTRTTIQVRPSWLEDLGEGPVRKTEAPRPTRSTIEVRPSWLEEIGEPDAADAADAANAASAASAASAVPGETTRRMRERPTRRLKPPPLPLEPTDEEPARRAMPPPLPAPSKKR